MKRVISVSLGSSKRDHTITVELLGELFEMSRVGTDGDMQRAMEKLRQLDGNVDAIGLGGIDIYLYAGKKRYPIKDGLRLKQVVSKTPVVDGSGVKNTLERETVSYLLAKGLIGSGSKVLMVSAVDRFGMAEAFNEAQCDITFGDLMFAVGIPCPLYSIEKLETIARRLLPIFTKVPFKMLYPTGNKQDKNDIAKATKYAKYYHRAEIIAGDYHLIRKYLPEKLNGQMIITNTTTAADVDMLAQRGAGTLVTTTPEFNGRSFGTNVIEAVLVAMLEKSWEDTTPEEYSQLLRRLNFKPRIVQLNPVKSNEETIRK
ncbi:quinate 5-dehydrogenase [Peptococcaceae bacterium 1198_IL3148]